MSETMLNNSANEQIADSQIIVLLVGSFEKSWLDFLAWKNTYPLSQYVKFYHVNDNKEDMIGTIGNNYRHNSSIEKIAADIQESTVSFIILGDVQFVDIDAITEIAKLAATSAASIMYISNNHYALTEVEQFKKIVGVVIVSDQNNSYQQPIFEHSKAIHLNNDLTMLYIVEALTNSIFRPDLAVICIDFMDIKVTLDQGSQGFIGSAVASNVEHEDRATYAAKKAIECTMLKNTLVYAIGVYILINYGVSHNLLSEFSTIADVIENYIRDDVTILMGLRHNKYLEADEIQVIILAVI